MPAIHPARLKIQAAQLVERFSTPHSFVSRLHDLLDFYANRAYRPGQSGEPHPLLTAYNVPRPVLHQVERELIPRVDADPQEALALADALWAEPYYEFRLLAAYLLGLVAPNPPDPVLERLQSWGRSDLEDRLLRALLERGLVRLRSEAIGQYLALLGSWLGDAEVDTRRLGLQALMALAEDPAFENLPVLFHLLGPLTRTLPDRLRSDVLGALAVLARRSPQETAYFLRQNLDASSLPAAAWLIRQLLDEFPSSIQANLRTALKNVPV